MTVVLTATILHCPRRRVKAEALIQTGIKTLSILMSRGYLPLKPTETGLQNGYNTIQDMTVMSGLQLRSVKVVRTITSKSS